MVRRAAIAIGENWSNDTYRLAAVRCVLRSAEADLMALLPPPLYRQPAPRASRTVPEAIENVRLIAIKRR